MTVSMDLMKTTVHANSVNLSVQVGSVFWQTICVMVISTAMTEQMKVTVVSNI